jgi:hypothetical protein
MDNDSFLVGLACLACVLAVAALVLVFMLPAKDVARVVTAMELCLAEPQCVVTPEDWERYQRALRRLGENDEM